MNYEYVTGWDKIGMIVTTETADIESIEIFETTGTIVIANYDGLFFEIDMKSIIGHDAK